MIPSVVHFDVPPRRIHEREITKARRQLAEYREAAEEEAGKREYEIKMLEGDLARGRQGSQVHGCFGTTFSV